MIDRMYSGWVLAAEQLMAPLVARMHPDAALLPLGGIAGSADAPDPSDEDVDHFIAVQAVAGWASSGIIVASGADRTHFLTDTSYFPVLETDGVEGEKGLVCQSQGGQHPSNDWKMVSSDEPGVVFEKENESRWEIRFE